MKEDDIIYPGDEKGRESDIYDPFLVREYLRFRDAGSINKPDPFPLDASRCAKIMQHQADLIDIQHIFYFNYDHGVKEKSPETERRAYYSEEPVFERITYGDVFNFHKGLMKWIATEVAPAAQRQGIYIPLIPEIVDEAGKNGWEIPPQPQAGQPPPGWAKREDERREGGQQQGGGGHSPG